MARLLHANPSVNSTVTDEPFADCVAASHGQMAVQPAAFTNNTEQLNNLPKDKGGFLNNLPFEAPLTIAYVATFQLGNCMIYVSPQVACLGFSPEAWLGDPGLRMKQVHKEDLERVEKALRDALSASEKFSCCYRLYDSAGNVRWFHDEASVVCDESGAPLAIMGAMRDITEIKMMEIELDEHRYYLEQKVEQRTEQLARRITLLESCNAALSSKLAQARSDIAELNKMLAIVLPDTGSNDCPRQLSVISDSAQKRSESGAKESWIGCAVTA